MKFILRLGLALLTGLSSWNNVFNIRQYVHSFDLLLFGLEIIIRILFKMITFPGKREWILQT